MFTCRTYGPKAAGTLAARNPSREQPAKSADSPASAIRRDMVLGLPAGMGGAPVRIEQAVPHQPIPRILCILIKPLRGTSQPERVAPLIHVAAHPFAADVRQRLRQYDLQITDRILFRMVAAGIGIQPGAPLRRHANEMGGLVQHGMHWRVEARKDSRSDQARLALA